jgi:LysR family transcriptional activator of nhaA
VARHGSISAAARALHVTQPAVTGQLRRLERRLGGALYRREGNRLELTELGRTVLSYADDIHFLGRELTLRASESQQRAPRLRVGIPDTISKWVVNRVLSPTFTRTDGTWVSVHEGPLDRLADELLDHRVDLVISDRPTFAYEARRLTQTPALESDVTLFGTSDLVTSLRKRFPKSLDGAPFLLPGEGLSMRRALDDWFAELNVTPKVVAEVADSALLKVFGSESRGIFPAPSIVASEVKRRYGVVELGSALGVKERYFLLTTRDPSTVPALRDLLASFARP